MALSSWPLGKNCSWPYPFWAKRESPQCRWILHSYSWQQWQLVGPGNNIYCTLSLSWTGFRLFASHTGFGQQTKKYIPYPMASQVQAGLKRNTTLAGCSIGNFCQSWTKSLFFKNSELPLPQTITSKAGRKSNESSNKAQQYGTSKSLSVYK